MKLSRAILFCLIGVFVAQFAFYYPNLPESVASHFGADGIADGFMRKSNFAIFEAVLLLLLIGEFTVLPALIEKFPDSLINLPNKNYWLAAERRPATFAVLQSYFEWLSVLLLLLFIAVNQAVFKANINRENLGSAVLIILILFLAAVTVWMIKFIKHFNKI